jgi:elongation factor 1 alpha-like protein
VLQVCVAVNKLDLIGWSKDRYEFIMSEVKPFLKSIGFKDENISFVPISGLEGVNLSEKPT